MADFLYHFSEDPTIEIFEPRVAKTQQIDGAWVWADDEIKSARYWFPRDCPRGTWWRKNNVADRVHTIQWDWFDRFAACNLFAYTFAAAPFKEVPGGWITDQTVMPLEVKPVGPLLDKHRDAAVELRIVPDLKALWLEVIEMPDIEFSGIRLKNLD